MKNITIKFGALSDNLEKQLECQGFSLPDGKLIIYQKLCNSISCLHVNDILTDSETTKARKKLLKQIAKKAIPLNNEEK